jgi:Holliday junction DNA helicase RuvA
MIAWLSGRLRRKSADAIVVDVGGVGYQVAIALSTFRSLPEPGEGVDLHIHTQLREDSLSLYGFSTEPERDLFQLLLGVSGVGPKLALSVLSGMSVADLAAAVRTGDDAKLRAISGIGSKTAARLCLELKDKVRQLLPAAGDGARPSPAASARHEDAVSALMSLGYRRQPSEEAVQKVLRAHSGTKLEELIRKALGELSVR